MIHYLTNILHLVQILRRILYVWFKSRATPGNQAELGLDLSKPVCYVLRSRSLADLVVLTHHCQKMGLPMPKAKLRAGGIRGNRPKSLYCYIFSPGIFRSRMSKEMSSEMQDLMKAVEAGGPDVQIVPVSVLWGRHPGTEEKTLLNTLFTDHVHQGWLPRLLTVMTHGRSVICNFGNPFSLKEFLGDGIGLEQSARKFQRVLRVHFRSVRLASLGPLFIDRDRMKNSILAEDPVREAIQEEISRKKISASRARKRANRYLTEIAAHMSVPVIRMVDIFLTWLWNKVYRGIEIHHIERLRRHVGDRDRSLVYVPCHRSHADYLLIGHSLYDHGFVNPHIAAGLNLNFWPMGHVLRRGGAFFIRRSFKGNRLYSVVFAEYVSYLIGKGFPLKFFIEGGRSRTGRLLQPKIGLLNIIVQGFVRSHERPVSLVPVYVGYDKIFEGASYLGELGGRKKKNESFGQLLQARHILRKNFGKAYLSFGEPIDLEAQFDELQEDWRELGGKELGERELGKSIRKGGVATEVARRIMVSINKSAVLTPSALFATALLSNPKRAFTESDLLAYVGILEDISQLAPLSPDVRFSSTTVEARLKYLEEVLEIHRFNHPDGDVIHIDEREAVRQTYYRNNTLHLFAIPSLIAAFFTHNDEMDKDVLWRSASNLYEFLKQELFLPFEGDEFSKYYQSVLSAMLKVGVILGDEDSSVIKRPDVTSREFCFLGYLGRIMSRSLERYAVASALLARIPRDQGIDRTEFEAQCRQVSQRVAVLNGTSEPEFLDKNLYRDFFDMLRKRGALKHREDGTFEVTENFLADLQTPAQLLSSDIRRSIVRSSEADSEGAK